MNWLTDASLTIKSLAAFLTCACVTLSILGMAKQGAGFVALPDMYRVLDGNNLAQLAAMTAA